MLTSGFKLHLGIWFIIAVMAPSFILGAMALRAMSREEVFLEKKLEDSLRAETDHAAGLIRTDLKAMENELATSLDAAWDGGDPAAWSKRWRKNSILTAEPFLVSPDWTIVWPINDSPFLKWSTDFLTNAETTPVYANIAQVYRKEILDQAPEFWGTRGAISKTTDPGTTARDQLLNNTGVQYSPAILEQSDEIRSNIYAQAVSDGHQVMTRQYEPYSAAGNKTPRHEPAASAFIANEMKFSQITHNKPYGIIPFVIKEKMHLIFWKKMPDKTIAGCRIDPDAFAARIIGLLPRIWSETRILTVIDANGKPIITPQDAVKRDWRTPFASSEISELLPRWEVAADLTRPGAVAATARGTRTLVWLLIMIMLVSIITGGTLVLRSLASELRQARQKTTFAANVSHELKTPLTSIRMFAEMLRDDRQPDEKKRRQYLDIMAAETERLTRLINNVLDFARPGRLARNYRKTTFDIVAMAHNVLESQRTRLEYNGFTTGFHAAAGEIRVTADEEAVKQVLINLLSNAEKYSDTSREITVSVERSAAFAVIAIADRGIGIPPHLTGRIFEEFFRVDDRLSAGTQGTGLGLTIARRIARDHNGEIGYAPRPGGGSVFQLRLPMEGVRS
jgi:signal transduction histidine kinase